MIPDASYYCSMSSWVPELIRRKEEPIPDTLKRALGAGLILLATLPVSNKQGWTVPFALYMSDALGPCVRNGYETTVNFIAEQHNNVATILAENTK